MYLALLVVAVIATLGFRRRMLTTSTRVTRTVTAASITTIEAAFLRAGCDGVEQVRRAATESGAWLDDRDIDVTTLESRLAARGFAFAAQTRRALRIWCVTGYVLAAPTALAAAIHNVALGTGSRPWPLATTVEFAILWSGAAIAFMATTHLGPSTALGREALAMRRAAYPLTLLRDADPTATVALYGGTLRRRLTGASGDSGYVWSGDAGSGHGHGHGGGDSGGHGSHGCASSCGGGGCGGH